MTRDVIVSSLDGRTSVMMITAWGFRLIRPRAMPTITRARVGYVGSAVMVGGLGKQKSAGAIIGAPYYPEVM